MIYTMDYRVGLEEVDTTGLVSTKAIMAYMEDIAALHGTDAGHGLDDMERNNATWVLLNWQIEIINRPRYRDRLNVSTWAKNHDKVSAVRDFEIYSENKTIAARGMSRWIYMDLSTRRPRRLTDDIMSNYHEECGKSAFDEELSKIIIPENVNYTEYPYCVLRRDMDVNGHMHNLSYLDAVFEIMPEELYKNAVFNKVRIEYKKEIMKDSKVVMRYYPIDDGCIVTFSTDDKLNAVVELRR